MLLMCFSNYAVSSSDAVVHDDDDGDGDGTCLCQLWIHFSLFSFNAARFSRVCVCATNDFDVFLTHQLY